MSLLNGKRLELRPLEDGDAAALYSAIEASRAALKRRLRWPAGVRSPSDCRRFIGSAGSGRGAERTFGIFSRGTARRRGSLLGVAALEGHTRERPVAELSLWVRSDSLDKGYGCEAGKLLIAHAFKKEGMRRLYVRIDPANRAGRKVIQKLGFRYEGCLRQDKRLNGRWINQECWGLLRGEWRW